MSIIKSSIEKYNKTITMVHDEKIFKVETLIIIHSDLIKFSLCNISKIISYIILNCNSFVLNVEKRVKK